MEALHKKLYDPDVETFFCAYRWLAWVVFAGAVLLPSIPPAITPLTAGVLVVTATINILLTRTASAYAWIARERPAVMGLDIVVSVGLVWLMGGNTLLLPYALGSLVLPVLLLEWTGVVIGALFFVVLDVGALIIWRNASPTTGFFRLLLPVAAGAGFLLIYRSWHFLAAASRQKITERFSFIQPRWDTDHTADEIPGSGPPPAATSRETADTLTSPATRSTLAAFQASEWSSPLVQSRSATPPRAPVRQPKTCQPCPPSTIARLATELHQLAEHFRERSDVTLCLEVANSEDMLPYGKQMTLLKLAEEALKNVQQHAHAQTVWLSFHHASQHITLMVQDDGVGLMDGTHERPGVHSLRLLYYRLAEMDGRLEVSEPAQGGLLVCGILPLNDD